jgi:hypothetical protein
MSTLPRALGHFIRASACFIAAALAVAGCSKAQDIHDTPDVKGQPCVNCHAPAFVSAANPKHVGVFPETCGSCHNTKKWIPATPSGSLVDHPWFPLANKHASVTCAACHTKGYQLGDTPTDCVGCHQKDYDATKNPSHAGLFPTTCNGCHNDSGWVPATVSAGTMVNHPWFPLANKHSNVACAACHTKGYQLGDTPKDCAGCHQNAYDTAMNPPHAGLPTMCSGCHTDMGWQPSSFVHPWTLDGKHATTPCASCHTGTPPRYPGTPTACAGCHSADFQTAVGKVSGHSAFAQTCADCHTTTAWTGAGGGTHPEANFPITTGSHSKGIACADCHIASRGSPVGGQNTDCIHCHLGAHNQPAIDTVHTNLNVAGYPGPNASSPNFCLPCHKKG